MKIHSALICLLATLITGQVMAFEDSFSSQQELTSSTMKMVDSQIDMLERNSNRLRNTPINAEALPAEITSESLKACGSIKELHSVTFNSKEIERQEEELNNQLLLLNSSDQANVNDPAVLQELTKNNELLAQLKSCKILSSQLKKSLDN